MASYIDEYLKVKRREKTRVNTATGLKKFLNWKYHTAFTSIENMEHLAVQYLKEYQFQDLLDYLIWMRDKATYQPTTINIYLGYVITFLKYYEIYLNEAQNLKLRNAMPRCIVMTQDKPLTKEIIYQICSYSDLLLRTVILLATSSGMRINEILQLEMQEIEFGYPNKIRLPKSKMKQGRPHTYRFSTEAAESLHEWFEVREKYGKTRRGRLSHAKRCEIEDKNDTRVFPISSCSVYSRWKKTLELIGLNSRDKETGRHHYSTHSCRRWFSSTASRHIPHEIAEALIGHDTGLSSAYRRYPEDDLDTEYLKLEPHLSIFAAGDIYEAPPESGGMDNVLYSLINATAQLTAAVSRLQKDIGMLTTSQRLVEDTKSGGDSQEKEE